MRKSVRRGGENNRGLTLVEVMTVLALLTILGLLSFPSFSSLLEQTRFRGEVNKLFTSLHQAKTVAIKNNAYVVLQLIENGYEIFVDDGRGDGKAGDWQRHPDESLLASHFFDERIEISSNLSLDRTRFSGRPGGKAGTIRLSSDSGISHSVVINLAGNIRVAKG
jgi:prepilin-type N-terminal cleavage/methylation domain-containing protein